MSPAVEDVVLKALAKDPKQRFASVRAFAAALEHACQAPLGGSAQWQAGPPAPGQLVPDGQGSRRNEQSASIYWTRRADAAEPDFADPGTVQHEEHGGMSQRWPVAHPVEAPRVPQGNLPIPLTPFIGREQEVVEVCALLQRPEIHLVTLMGTGGVGKTRLGLQVASELLDAFADGVCFVSLAPISDPDLVIPTIAHTLGLQEAGGWPFLDLLEAFLRNKHLLLLLDNFEQVVAAAPQLSDLLSACSSLKILVTSRAVLHIRGEHEFPVRPLTVPDITHLPEREALAHYPVMALFLQRARAAKPDFQLTPANAGAIVEVCARLDGLPLAIELAAARVKLLPPQALLARLGQRLQLLTSSAQDVPARQQTLRKTIAWSYHLLEAQEQRLFRRLSVFVAGCTLQAAEAVCKVQGDTDAARPFLDDVTSLIDKSLLQVAEQEGEESRLLMLETIREYGLEALVTSGEMEVTGRAHAAYYLALAEEAEQQLLGSEQVRWLNRLEREHDNLRAALKWCIECQESEMALRLASALWQFWWLHGHLREGRTALEGILAAAQTVPASLRAKALARAGILVGMQGNYGQVEALCEESLGLLQELQDHAGMVIPLWMRGFAAFMESNFAVARPLAEQALVLSRQVDNTWGIASSLRLLASIALDEGKNAAACALLEEYLGLSQKVGNTQAIADALWVLGLVNLGDLAKAHALLTESLARSREVGDKRITAYSLAVLGWVAALQGEYAKAHALLEESLEYARIVGDRQAMIWGIYGQAGVAFGQGNYPEARELYEQCLTMMIRQLDYHYKVFVALCLEGLAGVVCAQGEPAWAARLWGAAETLRATHKLPMPPVARSTYEQAITAARTQLGEQAFAAAWAEGRTMTPEQALAKAERYGPNAPQ